MTTESLRPALVDVATAARFLGVGRTLLLELAYAGEIRSVKVGSRRLFPVAELERWVAARLAEQAG